MRDHYRYSEKRLWSVAFGAVLLLGIFGLACGSSSVAPLSTSSPAPVPTPSISVTATPSAIQAGQSATLSWQVQNATTVTLDGASVSATGTRNVSPTQNTTYTFEATGAGGTQQATATVTVTAAPPTASLTATPAVIQSGQSTTLAWQTTNATTITLNGAAVKPSDTRVVFPTQNTTYTLIATGAGGTQQAATTVAITPPAAPTVSFTATPSTIQAGQPSVLAWQTTSAHTVTLDGVTVVASGSQKVSPSKTSSYDLIAAGDGGTQKATVSVTVTPAPASLKHVAIIILENQDYGSIVGSSAAPYFNSLANKYALAANYFANDLGASLPDYFMLTVGDAVTTTAAFTGTVTADNVVRELTKAGLSWKVYAEGLPSVGFTSMADAGTNAAGLPAYVYIHNPFVFLCDVIGGCPTFSAAQADNVVPYSHLASDVAAGNLPNYIFIVPDNCNNAHDCSFSSADTWLSANVPPLLNSSAFQSSGILVITFDESRTSTTNGGGRVATILAGPTVKAAYRSTTFYQHQSVLRMMMRALGVFTYPNAAATAPDMDEFFSVPLP